ACCSSDAQRVSTLPGVGRVICGPGSNEGQEPVDQPEIPGPTEAGRASVRAAAGRLAADLSSAFEAITSCCGTTAAAALDISVASANSRVSKPAAEALTTVRRCPDESDEIMLFPWLARDGRTCRQALTTTARRRTWPWRALLKNRWKVEAIAPGDRKKRSG